MDGPTDGQPDMTSAKEAIQSAAKMQRWTKTHSYLQGDQHSIKGAVTSNEKYSYLYIQESLHSYKMRLPNKNTLCTYFEIQAGHVKLNDRIVSTHISSV